MDYIELLLAAQVRTIAAEIRGENWLLAFKETGFDLKTESGLGHLEKFKGTWYVDNPIDLYIPEALKRLEKVARQIQIVK